MFGKVAQPVGADWSNASGCRIIHVRLACARPPYRKLTRTRRAVCHDCALVVRTSAFIMRKTFLIALGVAAGAAFTLLASGQPSLIALESAVAKPATESSATFRNLELFGKIFDIARAQYVDKPDDGKLIASAINGMMSSLDPHSNYMDAKSFSEMQADTNGEFGGLGLQVTMQDG